MDRPQLKDIQKLREAIVAASPLPYSFGVGDTKYTVLLMQGQYIVLRFIWSGEMAVSMEEQDDMTVAMRESIQTHAAAISEDLMAAIVATWPVE